MSSNWSTTQIITAPNAGQMLFSGSYINTTEPLWLSVYDIPIIRDPVFSTVTIGALPAVSTGTIKNVEGNLLMTSAKDPTTTSTVNAPVIFQRPKYDVNGEAERLVMNVSLGPLVSTAIFSTGTISTPTVSTNTFLTAVRDFGTAYDDLAVRGLQVYGYQTVQNNDGCLGYIIGVSDSNSPYYHGMTMTSSNIVLPKSKLTFPRPAGDKNGLAEALIMNTSYGDLVSTPSISTNQFLTIADIFEVSTLSTSGVFPFSTMSTISTTQRYGDLALRGLQVFGDQAFGPGSQGCLGYIRGITDLADPYYGGVKIGGTNVVIDDATISTLHVVNFVSTSQDTATSFTATTYMSTPLMVASTINATGTITIPNARVSTLTATQWISTPTVSTMQLYTSSIKTSSISTTILDVSTISGFNLDTDTFSSIIGNVQFNLVSTLELKASFSPNIDLGLGNVIQGLIGGASAQGLALSFGAAGLATGATALISGRQSGGANPGNFQLVNGSTQLQISTIGASTMNIFATTNSLDPLHTPGTLVYTSSLVTAGTRCVRSVSDPINISNTSTIQMFGQWVPISEPNLLLSTLAVSGNSVMTGQITANGPLVVNNTANITGSTIVSTLTVSAKTTANGPLVVNNTANITGATSLTSLSVSGAANVGSATVGSLAVTGSQTIGGNLNTGGSVQATNGGLFSGTTVMYNATVQNNLNVLTNATVANVLRVGSGLYEVDINPFGIALGQGGIAGNTLSGSNVIVNNTLSVASNTSLNGITTLNGSTTLNGDTIMNGGVSTTRLSTLSFSVSSINGLAPNQAIIAPNLSLSSLTMNGPINSVNNTNTINWQGPASFSTVTVNGNEQVTGDLQVTGTITSANNITANNILLNGSVNATANITAGGTVTGANMTATNAINATTISTTGNISGANITARGTLNTGAITSSGNITGATIQANNNLQVTGTITSSGNISGANITAGGTLIGNTISSIGNINGANLQATNSVQATGAITAGGNITGASIQANNNLQVTGTITSGGNITGNTILANGNLSTTGTLQVNGTINSYNTITAPNLTISNNIQGFNVTGTNLLVSPFVSTTNAIVSNNLTVNGTLSMPNNTSLLTRLGSISSLSVSSINGQVPYNYNLPSTLQASTITMTGQLLNPLASVSSLTVSSINGLAPGAGYSIPSTLQASTITATGALISLNSTAPLTWNGPANINNLQSGNANIYTLSTVNTTVSGDINGTYPFATLTWPGATNFSTLTSKAVATSTITTKSQSVSTLTVSTINGLPPAVDYQIPSTLSVNNLTMTGTFFEGNESTVFSWAGPANFVSTTMEQLTFDDVNFGVRGRILGYPQPNKGISVLTVNGMQINPTLNPDTQPTVYFTQQGTVVMPSTLTVSTMLNQIGTISTLTVSSINGQPPTIGYNIPSTLFVSTVIGNGGITNTGGGLYSRNGIVTFGNGGANDSGIQVNPAATNLSMWGYGGLRFGVNASNANMVMQVSAGNVDIFGNMTTYKISATDTISTTGAVNASVVYAKNLASGPASIQGINVLTSNPNFVGGTITGGNHDNATDGLYLKSPIIQLGDPNAQQPALYIQNGEIAATKATLTNIIADYISTNIQLLAKEANLTQLFVSSINNKAYPDPNTSVPVGTVMQFAGTTPPAGGWLFCDASLVSIATYPQLFSTIGYKYTPYSFYPPANPQGPIEPPAGQFWLPDLTYAVPTCPPPPNYLVAANITSGVWNPGAPIVPAQVWSIYYTNGRSINVGSVFTPGLGPTTGEAPWVSTIVKNFPGGMVCVMNAGDGSLTYNWNTLTNAVGYSSTINAYNTGVTQYPQPPYTIGTYNGTGRSDQITWRNQQTNEVATHTHGYTTWADGQNTYNVAGANQSCGKQDRGTGPPSGTFTSPVNDQQNFAMPTSPNTIWMYSVIKY